jgi:hypothetical protein
MLKISSGFAATGPMILTRIMAIIENNGWF